MKRSILFFLILILLIIPVNVMAEELIPVVDNVWVTGVNEKKVGEELSLGFGVSLSGIQKGNIDSMGIVAVSYELIFDDTVFTVTDITSSDWDSAIYKEDGKYYVLSTVSENDPFKNKCVDGISFCADYLVSIKFHVNDTNESDSVIKMRSVTVGLTEMLVGNKELSEDDITILETALNDSYRIYIKKAEKVVEEKPSNIVSDKKPEVNIEEKVNKQQNVTSVKKSNNKYLKSLKIENYKIEFDKTKNDYSIVVDKNINKLDLDILLEDTKASYKVVGADDLKKNNYKVLINVTAENGDKNTYTINVKIKEDNVITEEQQEQNKQEEKNKFKFSKTHFIIGGICIGFILLLIIIIKFIGHKNDRKIEKALDEL